MGGWSRSRSSAAGLWPICSCSAGVTSFCLQLHGCSAAARYQSIVAQLGPITRTSTLPAYQEMGHQTAEGELI